MPKFELTEKDSNIVGKVTFEKETDYMTIELTNDKFKLPRLVHVYLGKRLIEKGKAKEVKGAKAKEREIETVVTPDTKNK